VAEKPTRKSAKLAAKGEAKQTRNPKPADPVIPLVHAPDDPGPDSTVDADPVPETSSPPVSDTWQRLRQLFR
jgi:hypothetical protein